MAFVPHAKKLHAKIQDWAGQIPSKSKFVTFLSHYKTEAGAAARLMKGRLRVELGREEIFLDSDDLQHLSHLLDQVRASDTVVVLLTKNVLSRPWCLLEIYTAIQAHIPIITVQVRGQVDWNADVIGFLSDLESSLNRVNPGAIGDIVKAGLRVSDIGEVLGSALPNIITM